MRKLLYSYCSLVALATLLVLGHWKNDATLCWQISGAKNW
jgi:hypothetical protein